MESFNGIIKKSLNSASILYNIEKILKINTVNDTFIKDINDELQIILKSLLNGIKVSSDSLLYLLGNGWYKNNIVDQLDAYLNNSPVLTAIKPCTETLPLSSKAKFLFKACDNFRKTNSDEELIRILKNFITVKWQTCKDSTRSNSNNSCKDKPKVVKICGAPSKKRMKSFMEEMGKKVNVQE
ncbi:10056_t:CDS:2, partial [Gigaspora margarita]